MSERLFVALWPPQHVVAMVDTAVRPVRAQHQQLKWQPPERWHITLAFLGERTSAKEIRRFGSIEPHAAEPVALHGSGRFGPVLWIGVECGLWLSDLARECQRVMDAADRRFHPHLTVARARSVAARHELGSASADLAGFHSPDWTPSEVTLVRSTTGPTPTYEVVARTALP
jgi:2'-5' RNA ligase